MNDLVQDIWHDLREKRLWPIAVVLAVAILAIPVVMTQSSAAPVLPAPTAPTGAVAQETIELDSANAAASGRGSSLEVFSEKNPFKPPKGVTATASAADSTATEAGASSDEAKGGGGAKGGGDTTSPPSDDVPQPLPEPTTTEYEYVADVTFWNGERRRKVKGMRKLEMLPSQVAPVLIFMGTADKGGNAVFLVDSTLRATGEGNCVPSAASCAFVHIGPGSEHLFTTEDGDSYRLRVDEIRRVKAKASSSRTGASASGTATRRFALPTLTDLVEVTEVEATPDTPDSTTSDPEDPSR